jgi:hypothetical protein
MRCLSPSRAELTLKSAPLQDSTEFGYNLLVYPRCFKLNLPFPMWILLPFPRWIRPDCCQLSRTRYQTTNASSERTRKVLPKESENGRSRRAFV